MKYFHPSYWFKMWLLSAPLFNSKNGGIYAKSIDNQNIKDWASNNTNLELIENQEEVYHLNLYGWGSTKTNIDWKFDLKKEIILDYNYDKSNKWSNFNWYDSDRGEDSDGNSCPENYYRNTIVKIWNLQKINPIRYKKIEFLGNHTIIDENRISWGDTSYSTEKKLYNFNGIDFHSLTKNQKIEKAITCTASIPDYLDKQSFQKYTTEWYLLAWLDWCQTFGITWYWENDNYFLQFHVSQYGNSGWSTSHGTSFISLGSGIRLYNDDNSSENQIQKIKNIKKRAIFEEKNITKWTNDFSKSINYEQHLPINNKTNFVSSNITNL